MVRSGSWTREVERELRLVWVHAYDSEIPPLARVMLEQRSAGSSCFFLFDW